MEVNLANMTALFTGFDVIFQRGFEKPPSYYDQLATIVRSGSRQTSYPWLGRTTKFREWLGERAIQALETHNYTIVNKHFEDTVAIDRNDIEDDQYGIYEPVIEQLGWDTKVHPDVLLFNMIKDSYTTPSKVLAYDGANFFGSHNFGQAGVVLGTNVNLDSGGSGVYWLLVDSSRAIRPFIFQLRREYAVTRMNSMTDEMVFTRREFRYGVDGRANTGVGLYQLAYASNQDLSNPDKYADARAKMRGFKNDNGLPFGALASSSGVKLLVPPSLEEVSRRLLQADMVVGTVTTTTPAVSGAGSNTNIWKNSAELIVSEYLA